MNANHDTQYSETPEEREIRKENDYWKDYANTLMIATPILMGVLELTGRQRWVSASSGLAGIAGLVFIVFWYGRTRNSSRYTLRSKYPTALYWATLCFGLQIMLLFVSFVVY